MFKLALAGLSSSALLLGSAFASTVTFDDLAVGSVVTEIEVPGLSGVKLADVTTVTNETGKSLTVFDTNDLANPNDGDLKTPISGGQGSFNNVLIFGTPGAQPNDSRFGGTATFDFVQAVTAVSIDIIDVTGNISVTLSGPGVLYSETFAVSLDTSERGGNPNLAQTLFFGAGISGVTRLVINYTESGAFDNLELRDLPGTAVPVPGALPLMLAGLGGMAAMRRRKKA